MLSLPAPPTSLIGREQDVAAIQASLQRLDAPGVGKTSLILPVAVARPQRSKINAPPQ